VAFWRSGGELDSALREILARVEKQEPGWWGIGERGYGPPGPADGKVLDWAVNNSGPWVILLKFTEKTDNGLLRTEVGSNRHYCWVRVTLEEDARELSLFDDKYKDSEHELPGGNLAPAVVQHVREWVRHKAMPALQRAKAQSDATSREQADHLAAMRKKYL
jgi:hypothetical protein